MPSSRLNANSRAAALAAMSGGEVDVLVIGGGATGAGIALDAATRGLSVAIVEAEDWAAGTSSRSSRLVHGGLRYLYNLDFALVAEALRERGLLLGSLAPHLVRAQPFLWPLKTPVIERLYSAAGVGLYDALAYLGARGRRTVPFHAHLSKSSAKKLFPDVRGDALVGAIRFYDARVDDARLVLALVRTAARYGALAANRARATDLLKDPAGKVAGALVRDTETGTTHEVRARTTIAASGVWTARTQDLAPAAGGLTVLASKGVHVLVARERIAGSTGLFLRTETSVLFIIPWPEYWIIGTTDTTWHGDVAAPAATAGDIDYILERANAVLTSGLTRADVLGVYAGLRPLLQPARAGGRSAKVSREHTVARRADGLVVIAGGKLTTYRVMAKDAVDFALGDGARARPSITDRTPLIGAAGFAATRRLGPRLARRYGLTRPVTEQLLARYGARIEDVTRLIDDDPALGGPLPGAASYLRAEVVHAVTHEGAAHLTDILIRRIRLFAESADSGLAALDDVAALAAPLLGWGEQQTAREKQAYRALVEAQAAAESAPTDAAASAALAHAKENR